MATSSDSSYSLTSLLDSLIFDSLDAVATGFIFLSGMIVLVLATSLMVEKYRTLGQKIFGGVIGLLGIYIAIYMILYGFDVNPAESWPQMTTGPRVIWGIFLTIAFLSFSYCAFGKKRKISALTIQGCVLVILTIAGSNTGTKHIMLGLWILAPVVCYIICSAGKWLTNEENLKRLNNILDGAGIRIRKVGIYIGFGIAIALFLYKLAGTAYYTFNFDSIDRTQLIAQVDSDKLKGLYTTEREAEALNGVLEVINEDEDQPLMVFGSSLLFYYLTEKDAYITSWVTSGSYTAEEYSQDLESAEGELPIVIYGKTSDAYGFGVDVYDDLRSSELTNFYSGKKEVLLEFLKENNYKVIENNNYYMVMEPVVDEEVDFSYFEEIAVGY